MHTHCVCVCIITLLITLLHTVCTGFIVRNKLIWLSIDVVDFHCYDAATDINTYADELSNKRLHEHTETYKHLNRVRRLGAEQVTSNWVFLNDNTSWVYGFVSVMSQSVSSSAKLTQSQTHGHTHRHGGKIREDHGKGIFSMLRLVSPGRQDWWRDGSISCSINAFSLRVVHVHLLLPTQGRAHVTFQRSVAGGHECASAHVCVCIDNILPLSVAVSSYSVVEGSAGTSGSMFMMRFLWLKELKLRLWPNWALKT